MAGSVITSSTVESIYVQIDGRSEVTELHVDEYGKSYNYVWMCEHGADTTAQLSIHATTLANQLAALEIANNTIAALNQGVPPLTFNYSTTTQGIQALQVFWATATGWPAVQMGNYISSLNLSDATLENIFGVSAGAQLTNLKNLLASCVSQYAAGMATAGI